MRNLPSGRREINEPGASASKSTDCNVLRRQYRALLGKPAPAHVPQFLLARIVAYQQQARSHGDLSSRVMAALAAAGGTTLGREDNNTSTVAVAAASALRPGTVLVREHQGALHRVMVLQDGYSWNGRTFLSLSGIAQAITGVRWNGPRFFGLRQKKERIAANAVGQSVRSLGRDEDAAAVSYGGKPQRHHPANIGRRRARSPSASLVGDQP